MTRPILYSFRRCPYAIRARMALYYSGIACELREVVLKNKPLAMLKASPKGTVPVLLTADDNTVIDESLDIMQWALQQSDPQGWLEYPLDHELVQLNDHEFKMWLDRYKYCDRYPEQTQQDYLAKACVFLQQLETAMVLNEHGEAFLMNSKVSALDIAIFPFVRQFAFVDKATFDQLSLPKLHCWTNWFLLSPLFLNVMEKYPMWSPELNNAVNFVSDSAAVHVEL